MLAGVLSAGVSAAMLIVVAAAGSLVGRGNIVTSSRYLATAGLGVGLALAGGGTLSLRNTLANVAALRRRSDVVVSAWWLPSTVAAAFIAATAAATFWQLPDSYPISSFPMYSQVADDEVTVEQVRIVGLTRAGDARDLRSRLSQQVLLRLVTERDLIGLKTVAANVAARRPRVHEVVFVLETRAVTSHPDPVGMQLISRVDVLRVEVGR